MSELLSIEIFHFVSLCNFVVCKISFFRGMRGAFIVLEGLDRSGKSTQAAILCDALKLRGRKVSLWKYPARETFLGKYVLYFNLNDIHLEP